MNILWLGPDEWLIYSNNTNDYNEAIKDMLPGIYLDAPVITLIDAHPHSLSWIGAAIGNKTFSLGVSDWGQSGSRADLYKEYGINTRIS